MNTEFEITFSHINREKVIQRIIDLGGKCTISRTLMRRVVFSHPSDKNSYLRVRDEGSKITTTFKYITPGELNIESVKEIECEISSFDSMRDIYLAMGLKQKAYQETYREVWQIDTEIECMIDEWPGLYPFIEIEGSSREIVQKYTDLLGFKYADGIFGAVDQIYLKELGIPCDILNQKTPVITFDNPPKKYMQCSNTSFDFSSFFFHLTFPIILFLLN